MGQITAEQVLAAITGGAAISNAIFFGALYLGRMTSRLEKVEDSVKDHDQRLDRLESGA